MKRAFGWTMLALAVFCWSVENGKAQKHVGLHEGPVVSLAYSPDSRIIASGGMNGMIRLWDAKTGEMTRTIDASLSAEPWLQNVRRLDFSPNGRYIFCFGFSQAGIWEVETGKRMPFHGSGSLNAPIAFSPDSQTIAAVSAKGVVRAIDVESGAVILEMRLTGDPMQIAYISPDGRLIAGQSRRLIEVWHLKTGKKTASFEAPLDSAFSNLAFLPDSRTLAAVSSTGSYPNSVHAVHVWEAETDELLSTFSGDFNKAVFSPDGRTLATNGGGAERSRDNTIRLWDVETGRMKAELDGQFYRPVFSPDSRTLADRTEISSTGIWDAATGQMKGEVKNRYLYRKAFSPDGKYLAGAGGVDGIHLIHVETAQTVRRLDGQGRAIRLVQFSPNGGSILSVDDNSHGHYYIRDLSTGRLMAEPVGANGRALLSPDGQTVASINNSAIQKRDASTGELIAEIPIYGSGRLAISPDAKTLAFVNDYSQKGVVRIWDLLTLKRLETTYEHGDIVDAMVYSPDGNISATAGGEEIRLWDASSGGQIRSLTGGMVFVLSIAFSPNSETLVSGEYDSIARVWNVANGTVRARLRGHQGAVRSVAFSPDGRLIATAGSDGVIRVWSAETFQLKRRLTGHIGWVNSVAFSPDSRSLVSGGQDGRVLLWRLENLPIQWSDAKHPDSPLFRNTLLPNYPNPFNPETWIPFDLAKQSAVTISIYNSAGRTVRVLELGELPAGTYRAKEKAAFWDGRDRFGAPAASGVYFARIQAGGFSETRRMVLLK